MIVFPLPILFASSVTLASPLNVADDLLEYLVKNYDDDNAKQGSKFIADFLSKQISKYRDDFVKIVKKFGLGIIKYVDNLVDNAFKLVR
mgnify:CR=1 FL=1